MSAVSIVRRVLEIIIRHPGTHAVAKHLIRVATAELVRHVRHRTSSHRSGSNPAF